MTCVISFPQIFQISFNCKNQVTCIKSCIALSAKILTNQTSSTIKHMGLVLVKFNKVFDELKDSFAFFFIKAYGIMVQHYKVLIKNFSIIIINMSHVMRKPTFCICKNKGSDQLRGNRQADQLLCFHNMDSTIPLLSKSEIPSLYPSSVAVQHGLCGTWSETPKTCFLTSRLI